MATRETWVFPGDGTPPYLKGSAEHAARSAGYPTFIPDLPDFVSPLDGKRYSGRKGMWEHCKIHDVVPNVELKGLPVYTTNSDIRSSQERKADAAERKRLIINEVNKHARLLP